MTRIITSLTPLAGILISGLTAVGMGCASASVTPVAKTITERAKAFYMRQGWL